MAAPWASTQLRDAVGEIAPRVEGGDSIAPAMERWRLAFGLSMELVFAEGLSKIWGAITDEFTHPNGDDAEGTRLARQTATELVEALGDEGSEHRYCDRWIYDLLKIPR